MSLIHDWSKLKGGKPGGINLSRGKNYPPSEEFINYHKKEAEENLQKLKEGLFEELTLPISTLKLIYPMETKEILSFIVKETWEK